MSLIKASTQFAFSVGSILAPFLVGLYMDDDIEKSCDNRDDLFYKKTILYSHYETRSLNSVGIVTGNTTEPEEKNCYDEHWKILCDFDYFKNLGMSHSETESINRKCRPEMTFG